MNKDLVNIIGIKQESRQDSIVYYLKDLEGLKDTFNKDFNFWSDFDRWEILGLQQWIFARAIDIYRGHRIDIKCDCCEYIDLTQVNFKTIANEECYGKKTAYIIEKVLNEIVTAKERREFDGTYSA